MHPATLTRRRIIAALASAAGLFSGSLQAQPPVNPQAPMAGSTSTPVSAKTDPKTGSVFVPVQGIVRYSTGSGKPIQSITFTKDQVVQSRLIPTAQDAIDLIGVGAGLTDMVIKYADGTTTTVSVIAQPDYDLLKNIIKRTMPTASVDVVPGVGQAVILTGYVNRPEDAATIERIAQAAIGVGQGGAGGTAAGGGQVINAIRVGGSQHVMIDVVVASVDRSELRSRGISFLVGGTTASGGSFIGGLIDTAGGVSSNSTVTFGIVPPQITGALRALRTENMAKFLAEPKVVTQTGRPAYILAGGRQAVLGPSSGLNGPGVQYENIGTQLEVLPLVQGDGRILLEINPMVRSVNQGLGITTVFGSTPGFTENMARSVVSLESGQTFAIGGMIQSSVQASSNKIPLLGDLPYIGGVFGRSDYEERESELIILVTPRLVEPLDCMQVPRRVPGRETRSPDDYEFFLENLLEAPRGQRQVWNGRHYNAAYKCDPTANRFPCVGNVCTGLNGGCNSTTILTSGCTAGGCATANPAAPASTVPTTLPNMAAPVETVAPVVTSPVVVTPTPVPAIEPPVLNTPAVNSPVVAPIIEGPKQ